MKKILTTLLLLGGTSMAATISTATLVSNIQTELTNQEYVAGDSFAITFTLESAGWNGANWAGILTLGTEFGGDAGDQLRLETTTTGLSSALIGVALDGAALASGEAEYWTSGTRVWDSSTLTSTTTFDTPANAWMQFAETATTGADAKADNSCDLQSATITLSYDYTTRTSSVQVVNAGNVTSVLNFKDTSWNAKRIANGGWTSSTWGDNVTVNVTHMVPEPATATLSLLALAGLAARRHRK